MATAGIGVDMLEIARMERVIGRRPSFLQRVFTDEERAYCERCARPAEHYAARWAAREAVLKALGTGFSQGVRVKDVWVSNDESGRPRAVLEGAAAQVAERLGVREIALSISHTRDVAVANAIAVTDEARPAPDRRDDARKALAASFREARGVLDELDRLQEQGLAGLGSDAPAAPDADATAAPGPGAAPGVGAAPGAGEPDGGLPHGDERTQPSLPLEER